MGSSDILIETIVVGPLATNCYMVASGPGAAAAVIDPGDEVNKILLAAAAHQLTVTHIINTHGHYDHIGANNELAAKTGAKIHIHHQEIELLKDEEANLAGYLGAEYKMAESNMIVDLREGDIIEVGARRAVPLQMRIIHTPGHTSGGISIHLENNLFTGDLIFAGSVGRTDLPGGDFAALIKSIESKVLTLPDDTIIYPGHGPVTSVGFERKQNPYLRLS